MKLILIFMTINSLIIILTLIMLTIMLTGCTGAKQPSEFLHFSSKGHVLNRNAPTELIDISAFLEPKSQEVEQLKNGTLLIK